MGRGPQAYPYGFWCFPVKCFPKKPEFPEFPVTPLFKGLPLIVVKPIEFFVFLVVDLTTPSEIALSYLHLPWETATCGCYTPFSFPKVAIPWAFFLWNFQRTLPHAFGNKALVAVFFVAKNLRRCCEEHENLSQKHGLFGDPKCWERFSSKQIIFFLAVGKWRYMETRKTPNL